MTDGRQPESFPFLDLTRGSMACLVFLSHCALFTGAAGPLRHVFRLGGVAVEIFMFVSGFLMLWHYLARESKEPWGSPRTWTRFWCRRFFRMAPLYWTVLTGVYLFHDPLHHWMHEIHRIFPLPWAGREVDPGRIDSELGPANAIVHYTFLFGLFPQWASNNVLPDWSITLEMQFYLLFPVLALILRKWGWVATLGIAVGLWQVFLHKVGVGLLSEGGPWGWYPMPTILPLRLGVFFSGMLAALALRRWYAERKGLPAMMVTLGLSWWADPLLAAFVLTFLSWETTRDWMGMAFPRTRKALDNLLCSRPVTRLADASYGIYLCHSLVLLSCIWLLLRWQGFEVMHPLQRFALVAAGSSLPVFVMSLFLYRWIEKPGIRMGKRILAARP